MPHVIAKPLGDSVAVAGTMASSSDACHGRHACLIVISSTSKDGGAETTNDLQGVSVPNSYDDYDEDVESLTPKKK